jgi:hypothetical protein
LKAVIAGVQVCLAMARLFLIIDTLRVHTLQAPILGAGDDIWTSASTPRPAAFDYMASL